MSQRLFILLLAILFTVGGLTPATLEGAGKEPPKPAASKAAPVDINSASIEELKALPGIGDAISKKIVDNRPYKRKDELVQKKILPQSTYDKIKDQIVAKQDKK